MHGNSIQWGGPPSCSTNRKEHKVNTYITLDDNDIISTQVDIHLLKHCQSCCFWHHLCKAVYALRIGVKLFAKHRRNIKHLFWRHSVYHIVYIHPKRINQHIRNHANGYIKYIFVHLNYTLGKSAIYIYILHILHKKHLQTLQKNKNHPKTLF